MNVIIPAQCVISASSLAEPAADEVVYSSTATYADKVQVVNLETHTKYESLVAGNMGKPLPVPPEKKTDFWEEVGKTNKYAAFDLSRNSQSVGASSMYWEFSAGQRINAIGVLGIEADSVHIEMKVGADVVYSHSENLIFRRVQDAYDYDFQPFARRTSVAKWDLPPYSTAVVRVTLTAAAGQVRCGSIIVGTAEYLGAIQFGAESDCLNFSQINRDIYGTTELVARRTLPKTTQTTILPKARVDRVRDVRVRLNAVPALWSGLDDLNHDYAEALLILGVYKRFSINLKEVNDAIVNLEVEEI